MQQSTPRRSIIPSITRTTITTSTIRITRGTATATATATASFAVLLALTAPAIAGDETAFERGLERFQAGDYSGAIAPLAEAHRVDPGDPDTALLLGIAYYKLGHLDAARPLLVQAERSPDSESQASAQVFLGLIAEAAGEVDRARGYYTLVARSPTDLGGSGRLLLERSGPERWSVAGLALPGYDSNVGLQPATARPSGPGRGNREPSAGDGELALIGTGSWRPIPRRAVVLDDSVVYRRYAQQTAFDMVANDVGATYTLVGRWDRGALAYHFDASTLGGVRYELAHLVDASAHHQIDRFAIGARYRFAARDYAGRDFAGYSGLVQTLAIEIAHGTGGTANEFTAGYVWEHEGTDDRAVAFAGNGGRAAARVRVSPGVDLRATALASDRLYLQESAGRRDVYFVLDAAAYVDLSSAFGLVIGSSLTRNVSTAADFDYTKWMVSAGVIAAISN